LTQASRRCLYNGRAAAVSVLGFILSEIFRLEGRTIYHTKDCIQVQGFGYWQTRMDLDKQGYRKTGDQTHSGRTLYPAGYTLERDHSPGGQPLEPEDCLLAIA